MAHVKAWSVALAATLIATGAMAAVAAGRVELEIRPLQDKPYGKYDPEKGFTAATFTASDGMSLGYRLFTPPPARNGAQRPMVVVLHGAGQIGTDNWSQLDAFPAAWVQQPIARDFPAYIVVPQVPIRSTAYFEDTDGLRANKPGPSFAAEMALIDSLVKSLPVDRSRIYITGFSMGAATAELALVERPDLFAAGVSFSGIPPERARAASVAHTPLLMVHGTADKNNPIESDRAWAKALAAAGGHPRMIEVTDMPHQIPTEMVEATDWRTWLFAQRKH